MSRDVLRLGPIELARVAWSDAHSLSRHEHEQARVIVVLAGTFRERRFGTTYEHGPGTMLIRHAREPHSDRYGPGGGTYVRLCVDDASLSDALPVTTRRPQVVPSAGALAARLAAEIRSGDRWSALASYGLALELLAVAGRHAADERMRPRWLDTVCDALRDDPRRRWTLAELALLAGVEPVRFSRTFRRYVGITTGAYLRHLRVQEARRLIESGRGALSQIAVEAGFCDQSHLNRAFRNVLGSSPGEHRRRFAPALRPTPSDPF